MSKIGSVICFCSHDLRFLDKCIQSVQPFSDQILIPICDHFYNGEKENFALLQHIYQKYPTIDFIEFAYSTEEVYGTPAKLLPGTPQWAHQWHNTPRLISYFFLKEEIDWVLFLDVDEIFSANLKQIPFTDYAAIRFATYWYFQTADRCATVFPDGPLLVKRDKLCFHHLMDEHERMGHFFFIEGKKQRQYLFQEKPLVHHYSWVRTEEELRQKTKTWGHHWERDWEKLKKEHPKEDYVRQYTYTQVEPFWDPLVQKIETPGQEVELFAHRKQQFPHVKRVTPKEIFRLEVAEMARDFKP